MDFDQLETFLEVARLSSFSRAAERRFRTQPAISSQIRSLEDEIGAKLLDRSGGKVSITASGKIFQKYAEETLEARKAVFTNIAETMLAMHRDRETWQRFRQDLERDWVAAPAGSSAPWPRRLRPEVRQQHRRSHDQGSSDGDALLLAARQHAGTMRQAIAEPDAPQQIFGARARVGDRHPRNAHRHLGVLERGELRQQMMELKHEADVTVSKRHDVIVGHRRDVGVADRDRAAIHAIQPAQHVQQRALPHARRADDRDHLAGIDLEIEIAEDGERRRADRVALHDAASFEERHQRSNCNHERTTPRKPENTKTRKRSCTKNLSWFRGFVVS